VGPERHPEGGGGGRRNRDRSWDGVVDRDSVSEKRTFWEGYCQVFLMIHLMVQKPGNMVKVDLSEFMYFLLDSGEYGVER
jgi:hypothetical protein